MTPAETERLKSEMLSVLERVDAGENLHLRLSRREREVMSMMLEGQRLKAIAATLDISVKTVTTHRARLMRKLGVEDNLGLYRYGIRNRLITV
ncbi:MAG TPA: LuxR C-terminal-related transcriptional regulator [Thermoanaerobaculia bacterium]|nr:LuxR C-terminal-related transcriptional regulator [Thermoanaerobaculia bacterium]